MDALVETIALVKWPGDLHEVSVYVETEEGGLMGHSIVPFVVVDAWGSMGPCVTARETEEKIC